MDYPSNLRYTPEHEWIRLEDDGKTAVIGVTEFAQQELGDVVFVEFEPVGTELDKDAVFGTVEAVKTVAELYMPVSGTVAATNGELDQAPQSVNEDPYGKGWMVRIELADPSEVDTLLTAEDYAAHVNG